MWSEAEGINTAIFYYLRKSASIPRAPPTRYQKSSDADPINTLIAFFSPPSRERQWCVGMPDLGVNQNMIFSRRIPCFPLPLPLPIAPLPPSPSVSSVWLEDKMPKRGYRIRTQFQSFNSKKAIELSKWTPNLLAVLRGSLTRRCLLSQHLTAFPSPRSSGKKMSSIKKLSSYILFL